MTKRRDVLFYVPTAAPLLLPGEHAPAGGAETQMVAIARELAQRGVRVAFVVHGDHSPPTADGIDVIIQRRTRIRLPGVTVIEKCLRTLGALARGNASVVVQRNASVVTGLVAVYARVTRRRFVYSSANVIDFDLGRLQPNRLNVAIFHLGIRLANEMVVQTEEQLKLASDAFGVSAVLIRSMAEPASPRSSEPDAFLWIGRLVSYKHPEALLDLAAAVPEATFRMIGVPSGPDGERLADEIGERARSIRNLELLEPRRRDELGPLYDKAVAIVNTSEYEGMPNVFLEGWARGIPALALRHDPDAVIVRQRVGAFAAGDAARMADQARALWAGRHDQRELANRCIRYVQIHHSLDAAANEWAKIIG